MMGRDQPESFPGMPMPGGGMVGGTMYGSTDWSKREAEDRRRGRFAHDMATASGKGFFDFFPDAARIDGKLW
jgi:hypothetical protein